MFSKADVIVYNVVVYNSKLRKPLIFLGGGYWGRKQFELPFGFVLKRGVVQKISYKKKKKRVWFAWKINSRFNNVGSARRLLLTQNAKDNWEMNYLAFLRLTVNLFFLQTIKIFHRLIEVKNLFWSL